MSRPKKKPVAEDLRARLRREARRLTGPRAAILRVLQNHPRPMSNKDIHRALPRGECDLATVYRSLHLLEDMGLVARYDFGDGIARFEVIREGHPVHHHHLVCTSCSEVIEIPDCMAAEWQETIARRSGFTDVTHKLEFFGVCPKCQ